MYFYQLLPFFVVYLWKDITFVGGIFLLALVCLRDCHSSPENHRLNASLCCQTKSSQLQCITTDWWTNHCCNQTNWRRITWKMRMWSMKATTRSAAIGLERVYEHSRVLQCAVYLAWRPAAASSGATWSGIEHWEAFNTNSSLHTSLRRATWSVTCRSGKKGIFRAHSTALNKSLAASSHILSIPMILFGCIHCEYRDGGYGSALSSKDMKLDRYECPLSVSPLVRAAPICPGRAWPWLGGTRPRWTAVGKKASRPLDAVTDAIDAIRCLGSVSRKWISGSGGKGIAGKT